MFCKACGAQLPDHVKFCNSCGTKVTAPTQEANEAPPYQQPVYTVPAQSPVYTVPEQQPSAYTVPEQQMPAYDYTNGYPQVHRSAASENFILGIIGSLIGVAVGGVVYFLLGLVGIVSGLSGLVMVALGIFLYKKLAGVPYSVTGALITAALAAIAVFFAEWFVDAYIVYDNGVFPSFDVAVSNLFSYMDYDVEFSEAFVRDLLFGYLFAAIGAVTTVAQEVKNKKESV